MTVFAKEGEVVWQCRNCGYITVGKEAPEVCPACPVAYTHLDVYKRQVQNGRFSHKGKVIAIDNQNSWTDGGVASPTPFYLSTNGYGMMWYLSLIHI